VKEKHLYTLLNVINNNSNIKVLIREGLSIKMISELISQAIKDGYIIHTLEKIKLSEEGLVRLKELEINFKKTKKDEWIEKDLKNIVQKIDKNSIFVPNQNELTFRSLEK
jgi:hypothetical protein